MLSYHAETLQCGIVTHICVALDTCTTWAIKTLDHIPVKWHLKTCKLNGYPKVTHMCKWLLDSGSGNVQSLWIVQSLLLYMSFPCASCDGSSSALIMPDAMCGVACDSQHCCHYWLVLSYHAAECERGNYSLPVQPIIVFGRKLNRTHAQKLVQRIFVSFNLNPNLKSLTTQPWACLLRTKSFYVQQSLLAGKCV